MPCLPSTMTIIELSRPGGPEVLTPVSRPVLPLALGKYLTGDQFP